MPQLHAYSVAVSPSYVIYRLIDRPREIYLNVACSDFEPERSVTLPYVCLSVRVEQLSSNWTYFHEI